MRRESEPGCNPRMPRHPDDTAAGPCASAGGFTLVETLIAMLIMCFGLLAAGQMILIAAGSGSLARSQDTASVAAQNRIELLASMYSRDPNNLDLVPGTHGPDIVSILNQQTNTVLNRYRVIWTVSNVPDPRAGKILKAKQVEVLVIPVDANGRQQFKARLNKVLTMTAILSLKVAS